MAEPTIPLPKWAENDVIDPSTGFSNVQEPETAKQNNGLAKGDWIPRQWFNWLFRSCFRWLTYLRAENILRAEETLADEMAILFLGNTQINNAGLTQYGSLSEAMIDSWTRLTQAILHEQEFPVQFRDAADSVIGTGTVKLLTTMSGLKVLMLPPLAVADPDLVRIYGAAGAALPAECFPQTPSPPVGAAVTVFSAPIAVVENTIDGLSLAHFFYSSTGAYPTRHIGINIPNSAGAVNGWRATSLTFPSLVPNPL